EGAAMAADGTTVSLRPDKAEAPAPRPDVAQEQANAPANRPSRKGLRPPRGPWVREALFLLLPIVFILGGYWYVTGGRMMSTDDAYVEADKVGISTDVSGIVKEVDVTENQHVQAGQILYRLDDLPFQLAR